MCVGVRWFVFTNKVAEQVYGSTVGTSGASETEGGENAVDDETGVKDTKDCAFSFVGCKSLAFAEPFCSLMTRIGDA